MIGAEGECLAPYSPPEPPHPPLQVVNAVKAAVVERPHPVDVQLAPCLLAFLSLIADEDRNVRRAAVVALSAVAHHKVPWRGGCL